MAVEDLDALRSELPQLFSDKDLPVNWEEDWVFVPVKDVCITVFFRPGIEEECADHP